MGKVDNKAKRQIVLQRKKGHSVRIITDSLKTKGYSISRHAVRYWLKAYNRGDLTESNEPETPTQRTFKKVSVRDAELIQQLLIDDPSLSSRAVHRELLDDGAKFSLSTTKKAIAAAGFTCSKPHYAHLVRDNNKVKRMEFGQQLIDDDENFADVIFSDESSMQLHQNKSQTYRPEDSLPPQMPKPKHPHKVHVWAAISRKGPSKITIFQDIMESNFFTNSILRDNLLPFIQRKFPHSHRFQQDNDPKHRSAMAKNFMNANNINWWNSWPSESPDLNPIEMVSNQMKRHIARIEPRTHDELVNAIHEFWAKTMTREQCNRYIDHIFKVVPVCVRMKGKATGRVPNLLFKDPSRGKSISYFQRKLKTDPVIIKKVEGLKL